MYPSSKRPSKPCRSAFTLIELLVVMSIISLLIAMLLPALGKARETSRMTMCSTNIRGTMSMTFTYTNDFKSVLPSYSGSLVDVWNPSAGNWQPRGEYLAQQNWGSGNGSPYHGGFNYTGLGVLENYLGNYQLNWTGAQWQATETPVPPECICPEDINALAHRKDFGGGGWYTMNVTSYNNLMGSQVYTSGTDVDPTKRSPGCYRDRVKTDVLKPGKTAAVICEFFHGAPSNDINGGSYVGYTYGSFDPFNASSPYRYICENAPIGYLDGHVGLVSLTPIAAYWRSDFGGPIPVWRIYYPNKFFGGSTPPIDRLDSY